MSQPVDQLVPNPRRQILERILAEMRTRVAVLETALDLPHRRFTGRAVWVGPTARRFAEDLSARHVQLRRTAQAAITALEEEIRAMPVKVSSSSSRHGGWS